MRRISIPVTGAMVFMLAFAGVALAWTPPSLKADCAPDGNSYAWTITLAQEADYRIDWSFDQNSWTTVDFGSKGSHDFSTPRGGSMLYVRWTSDHNSKSSAAANQEPCTPPIVPPSASYEVACGSIAVTFTNTTPWLYALEFEVDGVLDTNAVPAIANPNDDGPLNVDGRDANGPDSATRVYSFPEDTGLHHVRWILRLGAESDYFFDWTVPVAVESDCQPNDTASLNIKKIDAETGKPIDGAVFKVKGIDGRFVTGTGPFDPSGDPIDGIAKKGFVCIVGLPLDGVWTVTEVKAPDGYDLADPDSQIVEVDNDGDCNSPDAVFVNMKTPPPPTATPAPTSTAAPETSEQPAPKPTGSPEGGVKAATGTPHPGLPDTATLPMGGDATGVMLLFGILLVASMGSVAFVVVRTGRRS